jgi:DNA-binding IclR family transcriptional regulator
LAYFPPGEMEIYFKRVTLEQRTENTITDVEELKNHLVNVVREGVAYDDEEQYLGIRDVAAPIFNADNRVFASIGVVAPSLNLSRNRMREIAPKVKLCGLDISRDLGHQQNEEVRQSNGQSLKPKRKRRAK